MLTQVRRCGMYLKGELYFVRHLTMSRLLGFCSLLGQSKIELLTLFRDVNQESVDIVLVTVAH